MKIRFQKSNHLKTEYHSEKVQLYSNMLPLCMCIEGAERGNVMGVQMELVSKVQKVQDPDQYATIYTIPLVSMEDE